MDVTEMLICGALHGSQGWKGGQSEDYNEKRSVSRGNSSITVDVHDSQRKYIYFFS